MRCISGHDFDTVCGMCPRENFIDLKSRIEQSAEWIRAKATADRITEAVNLYSIGLLTPGDLLIMVANHMEDWADSE